MMARHPPRRIVRAFKPRPGVVIPFAARLPVHRHAVVVVVRKLALILTCVVHHPVQPPRLIVAVTPQQLRLPFRVMAEDARHALRVRCQLIVQPDAGALPIAADFHQTPVVVVGQVLAVTVAVAQHFQPPTLWAERVRFKQPVHAVITADKPVALFAAPHCQPLAGAVKTASRLHRLQVNSPSHRGHIRHAVFIRVVRRTLQAHFIQHAPAPPEHPLRPFITAAVGPLPLQREVAGQTEINVIIACQVLGSGGGVYRAVQRTPRLLNHHVNAQSHHKAGTFS